eukprot:g1936.t1
MYPVHADDNAAEQSGAASSAEPKKKGTFNPVVFSRKETFSGPEGEYEDDGGTAAGPQEATPSKAAASLMHQSDANGNQQAATVSPNSPHAVRGRHLAPTGDDPSPSKGGGGGPRPRGVLSRLCCCLYVGGEPSADGPSTRQFLIPPLQAGLQGKKCLVLDLDETLVHSSFKPTVSPDYIIPVDIEGTVHKVYVCKRPGVDKFLRSMGELYEIVVFTASLSKYANPLLDMLDTGGVISHRLFREDCVCHEGGYVKDLGLLGRPLEETIIIDNSPLSYVFHPQNAIGCGTFIDDMEDRELDQIERFLTAIKDCRDVRDHLYKWNEWDGAAIPGLQ